MKSFKILFIFLSFILVCIYSSSLYTHFDVSLGVWGLYMAIIMSCLFLLSFKELIRFEHCRLAIIYILVCLFCDYWAEGQLCSYCFAWSLPILLLGVIRPDEYYRFKPLFYCLLILFIINGIMAVYERITMTHILQIRMNDDILIDQSEYADESFRSLALFGHPLNNANIMAFMSFMFYYSKILPVKMRYSCLFLGYFSLFCFNARGAIMISSVLIALIMYRFILDDKMHRTRNLILVVCAFSFVLYYVFGNFGGRLTNGDVMDESSMVRILTIEEFLNLSDHEFWYGGHEWTYGENGYIMTFFTYGIILGLIKICLSVFFAFNILPNNVRNERLVIFFSFIIIGSTNNNLYYPMVTSFYMLCAIFIYRYSIYSLYENSI